MATHHHYTEQEIQWLIKQDPNLTYAELTAMFNDKFGASVKRHSISDLMCKRIKAISRQGNRQKNQFVKGAKPKFSIGSEVIKQGYIWVKVNDRYFEGHYESNDYTHNWRRKSDVVWEKYYGKIPDGWFVIFLDKNPLNCSVDNLAIVNRSIHAMMNKNRWYSENKDITRLGLKWCELFMAIKGAKENDSVLQVLRKCN